MNQLFIIFVLLTAVFMMCCTSPYKQCKGQKFDDLENRIRIVPCDSNTCKLMKMTNTTVTIRFIPVKKVTSLINKVTAKLSGMPLEMPFLGVTGTSACSDVWRADTDEPAPCPLDPGQEYIYRNHFYIHAFYPETALTVRWSLDSDDHPVICFETRAAIVRNPKIK